MELEREFHAVGHGGFISEKIIDNNSIRNTVVFDCGSRSPLQIFQEIDRRFGQSEEREIIDMVIISHFHEDHINGLEHLLQTCNVRNLILPLVNYQDRFLYVFSQNIDPSSFLGRLILNPRELILEYNNNDNDINLVEVGTAENPDEIRTINIDVLSNEQYIYGNFQITITNNWQYRIFEHRGSQQLQRIRSTLQNHNLLIPTNSYVSLTDYQCARTIVDQVFSNANHIVDCFNQHSLTLYSGSSINNEISTGGLYLGDYMIGQLGRCQAITNFYSDIWNNIDIAQISHHASGDPDYYHLNRFNQFRVYQNINHAIIFANNTTNHPSQTVLGYLNNLNVPYSTLALGSQNIISSYTI